MTANQHPIGIDFGGSGIKAAPVDLDNGEFAAERNRIETPQPSTPDKVAEVMKELVDGFGASSAPIGVTVPGIVRHGVIGSAANIDESWLGADASSIFGQAIGRDVYVLNDADAAGLAEVAYGAAKGHQGLVIVTTLGTGIGSAMVYNGRLVPNSELGHLWIHRPDDGKHHAVHAESWAANSVRENDDLKWHEWAERLTVYYQTLERLFSPDLLVVGGGVSKKSEKFLDKIEIDTEIVPAKLLNTAGIVGAALAATHAAGDRV